MFSKGQLLFALFFVVSFIAVMIFSYRKDIKLHRQHYKGSIWILVIFLVFIGILFAIKTFLKD
ncbi:hypothetical protein NAT50_04450 [Flavobacterium sp. HXWNR70]|uniref:Uncharacterized protein n=1 Tax=Flavobacterium luminosum TaxID=2949086 RepID=A0ABT0TNZ3_9FLAO|nr:hypothetical protein [Flavobacterium sp. HXWNR70]MCL9808603.1 hypothetical protein [Flavobacterium sp. HXWNR70]